MTQKPALPAAFAALASLLLTAALPAHADTTTVLTTIPAAENVIQVSDGRMFASASDGLYLVTAGGKTKVPLAFDASSAASTANNCYFTGLTQFQNVLYAACTPDINSNTSPRYVLMMNLNQAPQIRAFYKGNEAGFYNGIAAAADGSLYLANFGGLNPMTTGKIVKMTMSAPGKIANKINWLNSLGRPNGMKVAGNTVYYSEGNLFFTGYNYFKKVSATGTGAAGIPTIIYYTTAYIDDFTLVAGGAVLATATSVPMTSNVNGKLIHVSESGSVLHTAAFNGWQPTAVAFLKSPFGSLLVSEMKQGNVFRFDQAWGLNPR